MPNQTSDLSLMFGQPPDNQFVLGKCNAITLHLLNRCHIGRLTKKIRAHPRNERIATASRSVNQRKNQQNHQPWQWHGHTSIVEGLNCHMRKD